MRVDEPTGLDRALAALALGPEPPRHDRAWLEHRGREVFEGIPLAGKSVVEIGCGSGLLCFYAASKGATRVVGLEPETDGSFTGFVNEFRRIAHVAGMDQVASILPVTFQDWEPADEQFDVVLSYNSINHLDESACIDLRTDPVARSTYQQLFRKAFDVLKPGGSLIVWEVSPNNFWRSIGRPGMIERTLEWHKHQPPEVWQAVMRDAGFVDAHVSWPAYYPLRRLGPLISNRAAAFMLGSRFRLVATRPLG